MKFFLVTYCAFFVCISMNFVCGENEEYEEAAITFKPEFTTSPTTTYLNKYDSITLNCSVDKLGGLVLIWKLGSTMLTIDGRKFDQGIDLKVNDENSYSIIIRNVTEKYEGKYECIVSHKELRAQIHNVQILRQPVISKVPADGMVNIVAGKNAIMLCNVIGNPMPNVTWLKNGKEVEGSSGEYGERLTIDSVNAGNEGDYECMASNKMTEDAIDMFKLSIKFPPKVEVESEWVHSGEGVTTDILCVVHASKPLERIAWVRKGGNEVKNSQVESDPSGTTHKLKLNIRKVTKDDFGLYTCIAKNDLGEDTAETRISGLPEKVEVKSEENGDNLNSFKLKWTVKSYGQIYQYSLKYRESGVTSQYNAVNIPPTSSSSSAVLHSQTYEMNGLKNDTKYDVMVLARNNFGWSKPSEVFTFRTSSDKVQPPQISNEIPEDAKRPDVTNEVKVEATSRKLNSGPVLHQDAFTIALFTFISISSIFRVF